MKLGFDDIWMWLIWVSLIVVMSLAAIWPSEAKCFHCASSFCFKSSDCVDGCVCMIDIDDSGGVCVHSQGVSP